MKTYNLKIVCPQRVFFSGEVEKIVLRAQSGDMAVLANHAPMAVLVGYGTLVIHTKDNEIKKAALMGGSALILNNNVTILSDDANWPYEIDEKRAEAAKERALKRLENKDSNNINVLRAEIALNKALARLRLKR